MRESDEAGRKAARLIARLERKYPIGRKVELPPEIKRDTDEMIAERNAMYHDPLPF